MFNFFFIRHIRLKWVKCDDIVKVRQTNLSYQLHIFVREGTSTSQIVFFSIYIFCMMLKNVNYVFWNNLSLKKYILTCLCERKQESYLNFSTLCRKKASNLQKFDMDSSIGIFAKKPYKISKYKKKPEIFVSHVILWKRNVYIFAVIIAYIVIFSPMTKM